MLRIPLAASVVFAMFRVHRCHQLSSLAHFQDFARQQYQQYQGHYPGYGYPPYSPPQKSGGGIPAFLWIALGAGAALAINKVGICVCVGAQHRRLKTFE